MRTLMVHSSDLGSIYHSTLEEFLTLNMTGTLSPEFDFLFSFSLISPNDESTSVYYSTGRRLLDNLVMETHYAQWLGRVGFLWGDLSTFTFENPVSVRPLLFDRDMNAGEEKISEFYKRSFKEGFLNEAKLNSLEYFSGGRGGYFWIYRPLMGIHIQNLNLPGGSYVKFYSGKAENYFAQNTYLSEHGGKLGLNLEKLEWVEKTKAEINLYNRSNDRGETLGLEGVPDAVLENNTVVSALVGSRVFPDWQFEGEIGKSFFQTETQAYTDWALRLENTLYLEKLFDWNLHFPVSFVYRKVNPDFIGKQNSIIDNGVFSSQRDYISNVGDSSLLYNNEETWRIDAKFGNAMTLLRLVYGGRHQIHDTGNQVASTHFLDGINENGANWWHVFFSNYGQEPNAAAEAYNAQTGGARKIETLYWRGNTETITLTDPVRSRKYISFLNLDFRQSFHELLGFSNPLFFQLYSDFQNLHPGV
ncbi:MAG: hypothetical protein HGA76_11440, partial [Candidatus Firestonebacteria bacterium]|nr:hypothetical protein [Candidatus Firestonebacteria bacterium]